MWAGGKGPCPCRPLTKYRNSGGGGRGGEDVGDVSGEGGEVPPPPREVSASIFTPPTAGTFLMGRGGVAGGTGWPRGYSPGLSLGQAAVGSGTGALTPPAQLPPPPPGLGWAHFASGPPASSIRARGLASRRPPWRAGLCPVCAPLSDQTRSSVGSVGGTGQTGERRNSPDKISLLRVPPGLPQRPGFRRPGSLRLGVQTRGPLSPKPDSACCSERALPCARGAWPFCPQISGWHRPHGRHLARASDGPLASWQGHELRWAWPSD